MSGYRFDRLRILVVDDNVHMRKLVITILQAFGVHNIFEAHDGESGWAALREHNPDLLILDWVMEGMSGIDLIRMVRANPQSPNPFVPAIMLSGHTSLDHVRQARDAGINEFIAKPVSVKTMLSRLSAVIEHPRPFVRTSGYLAPAAAAAMTSIRARNGVSAPSRRRAKG
jgi:CheY-like chemotaxis protein